MNGLMQNYNISSALAMEILESFTMPAIYHIEGLMQNCCIPDALIQLLKDSCLGMIQYVSDKMFFHQVS